MSHDSILKIYTTHRGALVTYASRIVGDAARAEDVVQEAYLRFDAASDRKFEEPVGYLYRIVRNLALDVRRRLNREARYVTASEAIDAEPEDKPSPESAAEGRSEMQALIAAMDELPERMRIALEMHRFGDRKLKDIAGHLGISVGLAHSLVASGLEHCRMRLCRKP